MEDKNIMIERQRDLLMQQHRQVLDQQKASENPDIIQITQLDKIQNMDVKDKYRVLEFLVKELVGMRDVHGLPMPTMQ